MPWPAWFSQDEERRAALRSVRRALAAAEAAEAAEAEAEAEAAERPMLAEEGCVPCRNRTCI
jgi:hypothetical protein